MPSSLLETRSHTGWVALKLLGILLHLLSYSPQELGIPGTHTFLKWCKFWGFELGFLCRHQQGLHPLSHRLSYPERIHLSASDFLLASFPLYTGNEFAWLPGVSSVNVLTRHLKLFFPQDETRHTVTACRCVNASGRWRVPL